MDRNDFLAAFMAAESEINLILEDLTKQLHKKMDELFQEPDERWVERILAFSFNKIPTQEVQSIEDRHLTIAKQAKKLMYLHGLHAKVQLEQIGDSKKRRCPGQMIYQVKNSPKNSKYLELILKNNPNPSSGR
ncbi:hypothetical protein [Desulfobacter curvatus]|uniref:hypothetical protein n=1 Tax=Desulfobacter curvatus TaxID=2290 RepID=UPI00035E4860|nr:hypothetical protein [Desulfobacter curvatus]